MRSKKDSLIGARIRIAFKGATNKEIAELMGKDSSGTMTNWMSGGQIPRGEDLLKIRDLTGYSIEWILTGEGPETVEDLRKTTEDLKQWKNKKESIGNEAIAKFLKKMLIQMSNKAENPSDRKAG